MNQDGEGSITEAERAAFDAWFRAHYPQVLAFAVRRVVDRATAEDVAADTFAVAWRRRADVPESPLPWLYGVALKVIANQERSSRRRRRVFQRLRAEPAEPVRDPAEQGMEREVIMAAFLGLTEAQREVLRLAAWEGVDSRGGAAVLGCSVAAYRVRLHRARKALAKRMADAGHLTTEEGLAPISDAAEQAE